MSEKNFVSYGDAETIMTEISKTIKDKNTQYVQKNGCVVTSSKNLRMLHSPYGTLTPPVKTGSTGLENIWYGSNAAVDDTLAHAGSIAFGQVFAGSKIESGQAANFTGGKAYYGHKLTTGGYSASFAFGRTELGDLGAYYGGAHAEGNSTKANSWDAHAEGKETSANGSQDHAEGRGTYTSRYSEASHVEGSSTSIIISNDNSFEPYGIHVEGQCTRVYAGIEDGNEVGATHVEGHSNIIIAANSNSARASHCEGESSRINNATASHNEGYRSVIDGTRLSNQQYTTIIGSHAEGYESKCYGNYGSHAEGSETRVRGGAIRGAHAEGVKTSAGYEGCHAEGKETYAQSVASHAEGRDTIAMGQECHAEGYGTKAAGSFSHAEGRRTETFGYASHAGGMGTDDIALIKANGYASFAHGYISSDGGNYTGFSSSGIGSVAFGSAQATGSSNTGFLRSTGEGSISMGINTVATADGQVSVGRYNVNNTDGNNAIFMVGKGTASARSNAFRVASTAVYGAGAYNSSGADYAEMFEWADGNPTSKDRAGYFVTLDGDKISIADGTKDSDILGIVSGNPSVCGDVYDDQYKGMYLTDIFGRPIYEEYETRVKTTEKDEEGDHIYETRIMKRQKLNPDYNPDETYVPRSERPEWDAVGLLGKLVVIDDGKAKPNDLVYPNKDGIATVVDYSKFRVMKRLDETHIQVLIMP